MASEKEKPLVVQTSGFPNIDVLAGKIDTQDNSPNILNLQAARIRQRFSVSWPVARLAAELHFGRAA